jgi:hypothetical protein
MFLFNNDESRRVKELNELLKKKLREKEQQLSEKDQEIAKLRAELVEKATLSTPPVTPPPQATKGDQEMQSPPSKCLDEFIRRTKPDLTRLEKQHPEDYSRKPPKKAGSQTEYVFPYYRQGIHSLQMANFYHDPTGPLLSWSALIEKNAHEQYYNVEVTQSGKKVTKTRHISKLNQRQRLSCNLSID